ncbi:MAG: cytochrome c [Gemmatimonadetes bacterium]|nr:cytochrome c [Gemmatimonadota bacterium]
MLTVRCAQLSVLVVLATAVVPQARAQGPSTDPKLAEQGKSLFQRRGCAACHAIGKKGRMAGPDLLGVTVRRDPDWLRRFLKAPEQVLANDSIGRALLKEYGGVKMPNVKLTDAEVEALLGYLAQASSTGGAK